jgi:hypothetical protein
MDGWMDGLSSMKLFKTQQDDINSQLEYIILQFYAIHEVLVVNSNSTIQWMNDQTYMDGIS